MSIDDIRSIHYTGIELAGGNMIISELEDCVLEYLENCRCLLLHWKGYSGSDNFRKVMRAALDFFMTNDTVENIISDTRKHGVVLKDDIYWVLEEINPLLEQNGLKKIAFVLPEDDLVKILVEQASEELSEGEYLIRKSELTVENFSSLEEAKKWVSET